MIRWSAWGELAVILVGGLVILFGVAIGLAMLGRVGGFVAAVAIVVSGLAMGLARSGRVGS